MSYLASRPEQSTSSEAGLLTTLNNLTVGGVKTAIQKTGLNSFANVDIGSGLPTVVVIPDSSVLQVNSDLGTEFTQVNSQTVGTTISNPIGTPTEGQKILLKITASNSQTLSFGSSFRGSNDFSLPTLLTGTGKTDYIGFRYNSLAVTWDLLGIVFGF